MDSSNNTPATSTEVPTVTVVGTANVSGTMIDDWETFNFGGVQFFNLGSEINDVKIPENMKLVNVKELINGEVSTDLQHLMQQSDRGTIHEWWILLDNQSTVDVFSNAKLLTNIYEVPVSLKILSTGGVSVINKIGLFTGYGWVWYHTTGIANILSLSRVKSKFQVTFNSQDNNRFQVHVSNDNIRSYQESSCRLYYRDVRETENDVVCITTVRYNKTKHSRQAYLRALNSRILQNRMTGPSYEHFKKILQEKQIQNCPATKVNIDNAEDIFGKSLQCLKGKSTRR